MRLNDRRRVLHITTYLQGGAGRVVCRLAAAQRRRGDDVTVCASRHAEEPYGHYPAYLDELGQAGVRILLVDSTFKRELYRLTRAWSALTAALGSSTWDVVHAHAAVPALLGMLVTRATSAPPPIVQTMHGWAENRAPEHAATDVAILKQVDTVVACSRHSREQLIALGIQPGHVRVVPNGVPASTPTESTRIPWAITARVAEWRRRRALVLCCIGEVCARKNQALLIDALSVSTSARPVCCVFAGGGSDAAALERRAAEAGLGDRVMFAGHVTHAPAVAAIADWLVLPSRREGLPLAPLEGFARGVPAFLSDIPELVELDPDGLATLSFRRDDRCALQTAIDRAAALPDDERRAFARGAFERWAELYDERLMVTAYEAIYENARAAGNAADAPPR